MDRVVIAALETFKSWYARLQARVVEVSLELHPDLQGGPRSLKLCGFIVRHGVVPQAGMAGLRDDGVERHREGFAIIPRR